MRTFNITVNGKTYEVAVEETKNGAIINSPVSTSVAAPAAMSAPKASEGASAPKAAPAAGATVVSAPMPGTILDIKVAAGDSVSKGQILCILEAMKMENEIVAPKDGVVASVHTSKGTSVNSGDALVSLN